MIKGRGMWVNTRKLFFSKLVLLMAFSLSACDTVVIKWNVPQTTSVSAISCPTGYIPVPHNTALGTSVDFCVSKYEMKNVGSVATATAAGAPWVFINQTDAKAACSGLGSHYHLISNPEWMTVARNVEQVNSNWDSGTAGTGILSYGHTNNHPGVALAASTDDHDETYGTDIGFEQKRVHTLSNGEVIWDLAGNVWEWIDWNVTPANKAYHTADGSPPVAWKELAGLDQNVSSSSEMKPESWEFFFSTLNSSNGMGGYYAGDNASGGAALRGADWDSDPYAGIFALNLGSDATASVDVIGFRCAYQE
jgi:formylglycine-generating enzyme required for sulfatase activity